MSIPQMIDDSTLLSSNAVDEAIDQWVAGTYVTGTQKIYEQQVWKVAADPSTDDRPDIGAEKEIPTWTRMGWVNTYRMFRDGVDSKTTATGNLEVSLSQTGNNTLVVLLGAEGFEAVLELLDEVGQPIPEYTQTKPLVDYLVDNTEDWCFKDPVLYEEVVFELPIGFSTNDVRVTIVAGSPTDPTACGRLLLAEERTLGITNYGTEVSALSGSEITRDGFNNLILDKKRTVKLVDYKVTVETLLVSTVRSALAAADATEALFIGSSIPEYGATIVFGIYRDFRTVYENKSISDMTLTVEGL